MTSGSWCAIDGQSLVEATINRNILYRPQPRLGRNSSKSLGTCTWWFTCSKLWFSIVIFHIYIYVYIYIWDIYGIYMGYIYILYVAGLHRFFITSYSVQVSGMFGSQKKKVQVWSPKFSMFTGRSVVGRWSGYWIKSMTYMCSECSSLLNLAI